MCDTKRRARAYDSDMVITSHQSVTSAMGAGALHTYRRKATAGVFNLFPNAHFHCHPALSHIDVGVSRSLCRARFSTTHVE